MNPVVASDKLKRTEVWAEDVGNETLRAVAFFAAAMFTQNFDNVMMPPKSHILGTPNREG